MSIFWLLYWIAFGINIVITAFVAAFFDFEEFREKKEISWSYVLLSDLIAAIPGIGILLATFIIVGVVAGAFTRVLVPKEKPFDDLD